MATKIYQEGHNTIFDDGATYKVFPSYQCTYTILVNTFKIYCHSGSKTEFRKIVEGAYTAFQDGNGSAFSSDEIFKTHLNGVTGGATASLGSNTVSTLNSTTTLLTASSVFTGAWEDVSAFDSVVVAVKTDQYGSFSVQFSPDGINQDSTLTRYYRTNQIEVPHRFTITRKYCRVVFTNDSASDQTYLRLQTMFGTKSDLNAPLDSTLAQDFDSTAVRPSKFNTEVALGLRQGYQVWNTFGYNSDVDIGTEIIASWGGAMTITTTAYTLSVVSTDAADDDGGTGCNSIVIYGIDANRDEQTVVIALDGTTPVVTTESWLGVNRIEMVLCGTGQVNAGTITATLTTAGTIMAQMPLGGGLTQQCIFYVPSNNDFVADWVRINAVNESIKAILTIKMFIWSAVTNGKQEVYRVNLDTDANPDISENPTLPFTIPEKSVVWLECTSDKANVNVSGRFSGMLVRQKDAIT
tara:strand:- start:8061 stop:9458 length:1398 start_codon:yes stop_codon:yes gene_type:complete